MPSYDININNNNITKGSGSGRAAGKVAGAADSGSAEISKLGRLLKESLDANTKGIQKALTTALKSIVQESLKGKDQGNQSVDIARIVKNAVSGLGKDVSGVLSTNLPKATGGDVNQDKLSRAVSDGMMKVADKVASKLSASFSKIGVSVDTGDIANSLSGVMREAYPKSAGKATRDLSGTISKLMVLMKDISIAVASVKGARASGGKVDISEIGSVLSDIKKVGTGVKLFSVAVKDSIESLRGVSKEGTDIYSKMKDTLGSMEKNVKTTAKGVRERAKSDPALFTKEIVNSLVGALKKSEALKGTEVEKAINKLTGALGDIPKLTSALGGLQKAIQKEVSSGKISKEGASDVLKQLGGVVTSAGAIPKSMTGSRMPKEWQESMSSLDKFLVKMSKVITEVKLVVDDSEIKKAVDKKYEIPVTLKTEVGILKKSVSNAVTSAVAEAEKSTKKVKLEISGVTQEIKVAFDKGNLDKLIGALNKLGDLSGKFSKGDVGSNAPLSDAVFNKVAVALDAAKNIQKQSVKETVVSFKELVNTVGGFKKALEEVTNTLNKNTNQLKDTIISGPGNRRAAAATYGRTGEMSSLQGSVDKALLNKVGKYIPGVIKAHPEGKIEVRETRVKGGSVYKEQAEQQASQLSKSLYNVQKQVIDTLTKQFETAGNKWAVVIDKSLGDPVKSFKLPGGKSGRQWTIEIANLKSLERELGGMKGTAQELVGAYKAQYIGKKVATGTTDKTLAVSVGKWLKTTSEEQIKSWDKVTEQQKKSLLSIKKGFEDITVVSDEMISNIKGAFGVDLPKVFAGTFAESEALRDLQQSKVRKGGASARLIRTLALPAAKVTPTGGTAFETVHGSTRAIPKFATFETGFERLFTKLSEKGLVDTTKKYSERIKGVGIRPTAGQATDANKLAMDLLNDLLTKPMEKLKDPKLYEVNKQFIKQSYREAIKPKAYELKKTGVIADTKTFEDKVSNAMDEAIKAGDSFNKFAAAMEQAGLSAFDVVKSLDKLSFENVYDIYSKIFSDVKSSPLTGVGKAPQYDRPIREFEKAIGQVEGMMPLVKGGRPRRALHQESVVNVLTKTSQVYGKEERLVPDAQKSLIRDLNLRIDEYIDTAIGTGVAAKKLPIGIRTVSSLGIPEAQAGKVEEFRPGAKDSGKYLNTLYATSVKMYADDLSAFAPFKQFQQAGRNISNVTNAMEDFGKTIETPRLRSAKEKEVIESGRYGSKGYGYNVTAELRTSASTFEDQIVIAGKLAKAVTSAVSTLVKPSAGGRVRAGEEELIKGTGVSAIEPKTLVDGISEANRKILAVLGVEDKYKGRADKALIESVTKAVAVVRGEDVEVQQAKLAETFLSYYGRKLTTRFGSKGVSIAPTGEELAPNMKQILQRYGEKGVKVAPKAELGVALLPKSMGELASELIAKNAKDLESAFGKEAGGINISGLAEDLRSSGNKFLLDLFKRTEGNVAIIREEAENTQKLFDRYAAAFKVISGTIAKTDIAGIEQLRGTYEKQVGGDLIKAKPIDVRISSYGAAKRGLQTEVMESVFSNVAGVGAKGTTTLRDEFTQGTIKDLLGTGKEAGTLSKYSKSLGFIGTEKPKSEIAESLYKTFGGKGDYGEALALGEDKALQAQRAAALESVSNYYSEVIDEMGKRRKGLVGTKFLQIIEEPHENPEWQRGQIEKGTKGARLNVPAFSAYSTIFGEQSEIIKEIQKDLDINAKKHWEYLKALQTVLGKESELYSNLTKGLAEVDISTIASFEGATGVVGAPTVKDPITGESVRNERSFSNTILDIEKFSKAFKLMIPTGKYTAEGKAEKEEFYMPGPLARGTYPEPLIAGERGLDQISRRLTHLVNMAKELDEALKAPESFFEPQYLIEKLPKIIGGMTKKASALGGKQTSPEEFQELKNIYSQLKPGLSETRVPNQLLLLGHERSLYGDQLSEKDFLKKFEEEQKKKVSTGKFTQQKAMSNIINKMSDMLIGRRHGTKEEEAAPAALQRIVREGTTEESAGFAKTLGVDIVQDVINKRTEALTKAKIDYYSSLSETALGKTGSVNELFFSRKIPSIMGKAVTAVVDKRDDLVVFMDKLKELETKFANSNIKGVEDLGDISKDVAGIYKGHAESIEGYERAGIPVLKQHELGIPTTFAKKVPVSFKRAEIVSGELKPDIAEKEGTLFELLKLKEKLKTEAKGDKGLEEQVTNFVSESLVPYIESIRFPFTGVSTIQPYKPKLLPGVGERGLEQHALMVPGIPEMDITGFDKIIGDLRDKVSDVMAQREEAFDEGLPQEEIAQMTSLINELNSAISAIIPKYVAQQQKLDFDGDQIEIHSSTTAKSRKEIEAHYKKLTSFDMSTADVFRDAFSYGAMVPPTGEYPIGQMAGAFEKKFPAGKGFEFLKSPFLTKDLDYMTGEQTLGVLGERPELGSMSKIIEDILVRTLPDLAKQKAGVDPEAILTKMASVFSGVAKDTDTVAMDLLNSVKSLDKDLGPQLLNIVETGLKGKLYEEKKKDAVYAQLFKIHTGPETEGLTRLHRIAESEVGFGGGLIGGGGGYESSERFKKMFPAELTALGGRPEEEFHTMLNEILRFGIQKGMDVKHAGERPVAGEMVKFLSKGQEGAGDLWKQIKGTDTAYGELKDFAEANQTAIENRLGALPTGEILKEAKILTAARGEGIVLDDKTREELKQVIVDRVGLKGFLEELSTMVQSAAIEGVTKDIESMSPAKRRSELKGQDVKSFAVNKVRKQMESESGIDTRELIISQQQPLYSFRTFGATTGVEHEKFKSKYGKVPTPKLDLPGMEGKQREGFVDKYKASIATAQNIQDALSAFGKTQQKGTYVDMISGAIAKLQEDQNKIEDILTELNKEGYDFESKNMDLVERLTTGKGVSTFASGIINMKEGLGKRLGDLSEVASVPLLSESEELNLEQAASPKLLSYKVKELRGAGVDIGSEEAKSTIESFVKEGLEKVKALKQLDRVFESISSRKYESRVISNLMSTVTKTAPVGRQDIQKAKDLLKTQRLGGGEIGTGPAFTMPREGYGGAVPSFGGAGGIVPVHVVSIAEGATVGVRDLESAGLVSTERTYGRPTRIEEEDAAEKAELKHLIAKMRGTIPESAFRSMEEVYSPSKLSAGGEYEYQAGRQKFDYETAAKQQVEKIKQKMTTKPEVNEFMKAAADVGTAIHAKLEQELEKRDNISTEVYGQLDDVFGGIVGGTADIIEYTSPEKDKIKLIGDIKTTNKSTISELDKIGKQKVLAYEDIKGDLSGKLAFKIEEAVSQLNTYLKMFEDQLEDGAKAEIRFYDKKGLGKDVGDYKAVGFDFDETRFNRDMSAIAKARQLAVSEGTPFLKSASAGQAVGAGASHEEIDRAVELASKRSKRVSGRFSSTMARDPKSGGDLDRKLRDAVDRIDKRAKQFKSEEELDQYLMPPPIAEGTGMGAVFENLRTMHDQARLYQGRKGIDTDTMQKLPKQVTALIKEAEIAGDDYPSFIGVIDKLKGIDPTGKEGGISGLEIIKSWKLYRLAVGEFLIKQVETAKKEMEELEAAGEQRGANVAYGVYEKRINRLQDFVSRSVGKPTDIYTDDRRFITPGLAKAAGVYQTPQQIIQKASEPLGEEDVKLRSVFDKLTKDLGEGGEGGAAPLDKIREALSELSGMDAGMVSLLTNAERVKRLGPQVVEAWSDLDKVSDRVTKLREALQQIMKFNQDEFGAVQKKNLDNMIKYLKSIENMYSQMDLGSLKEKQQGYGEIGLIKVPKFIAPKEQRALHERNIMKTKEYFRRPEAEGGPEVGDRFSYTAKVVGSSGEIIKNVITNFHKYGEVVTEAGEKVGRFSTSQKDLIKHMQKANASFGSAIKRVVMWGAASRLVYGGMSYLSKSLSDISELEQGVAQLRMVMSPLETDFGKMQKASIGFSKEYGVPTASVLKSMKIFAQQGLKQQDVIDRTGTATLASNVTTLSAKEATEALTAAMKVFRSEGQSSLRFLDAWSETEAKHAITAADMANAIKKSAAAARTAGVDFDQLNGIVAAIGSVTRQSGKEVGTSLRFIFRRLFSEKGPKELAKINIPVLGDTGELRSGFEVLGDLAGRWKDLTSAQKLNIAQSIGGTRQYNALIVLMNNWDEAIRGIQNSTNSKGSAERRNIEIMKTYGKQMEQTKAAATELKASLGKIVLPVFKAGLTAIRTLVEALNSIPDSMKAMAAFGALFIGYAAKGLSLVGGIRETLAKGGTLFGGLGDQLSKQLKIAKFEILGKGTRGLDTFGLKAVTPKAAETANKLRDEGGAFVKQGEHLSDFNSSLGQALFMVKSVGDAYNNFIGDILIGTGKATQKVGGMAMKTGDFMSVSGGLVTRDVPIDEAVKEASKFAAKKGLSSEAVQRTLAKHGALKGIAKVGSKALGIIPEVAGLGIAVGGKAVDKVGGLIGMGGEKLSEKTGLAKALGPLAMTTLALLPAMKAIYEYWNKIIGSAQDYEQAMAGARRKTESEHKSVRDMSNEYDTLVSRLDEVKELSKPSVKTKRQGLETYTSPLTLLQPLQEDAINLSNKLASENVNLVLGYDKLGNAVLKTTDTFRKYLSELDKLKVKEAAQTEVDILDKYIYDLTTTEGPEKWKKTIKKLLKSTPILGDLAGKKIKVSPAAVLEEAATKLNKLINIKNKYPLSTAADEDIKRLQGILNSARDGYQEAFGDFKRVYSGIVSPSSLKGLTTKDITSLLSQDVLKKAYELELQVNPKFKLVPGVKAEDIMGKEILTALSPKTSGLMGVTAEFTKANIESAGISARKGGIIKPGDLVTFIAGDDATRDIAGSQALVKYKETADGVFEWMVQYFNTKTLKVEERPFDKEIEKVVDNIFPLQKIQEDLEFRMDSLNTFVAGASAGLTGMSAKEFKKDFSLGERFFGSIPTTTLTQATKGFTPEKGFGPVELKKDWYKEIDKYFFKPMEEFQGRASELSKLKLGGLEDVTLSKQLFEEITALNTILKNNQIAIQFRALYSDLEKSFADGEKVLKEGLAVNAVRRKVDLETGGLMAGVPRGLSNIDLGVVKPRDLTAQQRLLRGDGDFRQRVGGIQDLEAVAESLRSKMDLVARAMANIDTIAEQAKGFGAEIEPKDMEKFVEKVVGTEGLEGIEKLIDIDNKVADHTFDTVSRLDDILSNMGDPEALERVVERFSSPEKLSAISIPGILEKLARAREGFEERGEQESVVSINRVIDNISRSFVDRLGFKGAVKAIDTNFTLFRKRFKPEELTQRAFGGSDLKTIFSKLSEYAPKETTKLSNLEFFGRGFTKKSFEDSKELSGLRTLQEDDGKRSVGLSRNIAKLAAVATVISALQKGGTNEIVDSLDDQIKVLDAQIEQGRKEGKGEKDLRALFVKKEGVSERKEELLKDVDFYGTVQSLSALTTVSAELASAFGLTERQIKVLGVGAVGTYAAVKLASTVVGKEVPESAKVFGEELKKAALDVAKGQKPEYKSLGKVGVAFSKDIAEKTKTAFGKSPEAIRKDIDETELAKSYAKYKTKVEGAKPEEYGSLVREMFPKETFAAGEIGEGAARAGGAGPNRFKQALAAYIAATLADFTAKGFEDKQLTNTLDKASREQSEQLGKLLLRYPEAAQKALDDLKSSSGKEVKEVEGSFKFESRLLDPISERTKIEEAIQGFGEHTADSYAQVMKDLVTKKAIAAHQQFAEELSMAIESTSKSLSEHRDSVLVESKYGKTARLNKQLVGFGGEAQLPLFKQQMSTQQKVYTDSSDSLRKSINAYSEADVAIDIMVSSIKNLIAIAREQKDVVKASGDDLTIKLAKEQHKKLNEEIKRQSGVLDDFIGKMREFGDSKRYLDAFSDSLYKLNGAILNVGIDQTVEELPGFKDAMTELNKLLGGSHPLARYVPSIEEERMAGKQGVLVDTRQDVERARLLEQLRSASSGEERGKISQRLRDMPLEVGRDLYRVDEQRQADRLKEQVAPYKTYLRDLEAVKQLEGLPEGRKEEIGDLQSEITRAIKESVQVAPKDARLDELQDAFFSFSNLWKNIRGKGIGLGEYRDEFKKISKGEELQYRGITLEDRKGALSERVGEVRDRMVDALQEAPTFDMMKMRAAVAEPVVDELRIIQGLLLEQASESGDSIDLSNLAKSISSVTDLVKAKENRAIGGPISGPGGPTGDKIPAMLSSGEYVIKTASAKKLGYGALDYMNTVGSVPKFAEGGPVFGKAAGAIGSVADFFKDKRLDIADWMHDSSKTTSGLDRGLLGSIGMGAMAVPDIGLRLAKAPLEFLSGIEQLSKLQVEGKLGETVKEIYSSIKDLNLDKIKGMGKGVMDTVVNDLSGGGTGITAGILDMLIPSGLVGAGIKKSSSLSNVANKTMPWDKLGVLPKKIQNEISELSELYPTNVEKNLKRVGVSKTLSNTDPLGVYYGSGNIGLKKGSGFGTMAHEYGHFLGDFDYSLWNKLKKSDPSEHDRGFMKLYTKFVDDLDSLHKVSENKLLEDPSTFKGFLSKDVLDNLDEYSPTVKKSYDIYSDVPSKYSLKTYSSDPANIGMRSEMLSTSLEELRQKKVSSVPKSVKLTEDYLKERLKYKDLIEKHKMPFKSVPKFAEGGSVTEEDYEDYLKGLSDVEVGPSVIGKNGIINHETLKKSLLKIQTQNKKSTTTSKTTKSDERVWWDKLKFWEGLGAGKEDSKDADFLKEVGGVNIKKSMYSILEESRMERARKSARHLRTLGETIKDSPRTTVDFWSGVLDSGVSEAKTLWGDTKELSGRFAGWGKKQYEVYSTPENYIEAFQSGIKDPIYNELMLNRDTLINEYRGVKDFFNNAVGSFKYNMSEGAVKGGYKPTVTPKLGKEETLGTPTQSGTWMDTLKWMADMSISGIAGKMESIGTLLTGGVGTVAGGLTGIASLPFGLEQSAKNIEGVSKAITYFPQTAKGRESVGVVSSPFKWFNSLGDDIGEEVLDTTGSYSKAAIVSSIFKTSPVLTTLFAGGSGAGVNPLFGSLAKKGIKIPGNSTLGKKINTKIDKTAAKQVYIKDLKGQLESAKPLKNKKLTSKIEDKLADAGIKSKDRAYQSQRIAATSILATRQSIKSSYTDQDDLLNGDQNGGGVFDTVVDLKQEQIKDTIKKMDLNDESIKYFTGYKDEEIQRHKSKKEFDEAIARRGLQKGPGGVVGRGGLQKEEEDLGSYFNLKRVRARRKKADSELFTKVYKFGQGHPVSEVQAIKGPYDRLIQLTESIDSGEFRNSELGRYKLGVGKKMEDTLTSDEQEKFDKRYKTSTQFVLNSYMQAHKSLKDVTSPRDLFTQEDSLSHKSFFTQKESMLRDKVIGDGAITASMLGGLHQHKRAELFGGYKKANLYSTIDPNFAKTYGGRLESGAISDEEKREYETKFEILKAMGGKELYSSLSPTYRKKYNEFRGGVLGGKKTLEEAQTFFNNIKDVGVAYTGGAKPIPKDLEAIVKNIISTLQQKDVGLKQVDGVIPNEDNSKYYKLLKERSENEKLKEYEQRFLDMMDWATAGGQNLSLRGYSQGGVITKTGPLFAHKGEYIVPKKYATGGEVGNSSELTSVNSQSIASVKVSIDSAALINELENIRLKVEETTVPVTIPTDTVVKVEEPSWSISVDESAVVKVEEPGWRIGVDVGDAGSRISGSISSALSTPIQIDIKDRGGDSAVGGEKLNMLTECVKGLEDRLLYVKSDLEDKIIDLDSKSTGITMSYIEAKITSLVRSQMIDLEQQLITIRSNSVGYSGEISRVDLKYGAIIQRLERQLTSVFNYAPNQGYL